MIPVERLARLLHRATHDLPTGSTARCDYCRESVPPFEGKRESRRVYCGDECERLAFQSEH